MLFLQSLMNAFPFLGILAKSDEALCYYYSVSSLTFLCLRVSCVLAKQLPGCSGSSKQEERLDLGWGESEPRASAVPLDCCCLYGGCRP